MRYPYGKAILITGASSGIGRAAAELFADAGYTVWAGSRHCEESVEKRQGGGEIRSLQMDVCNEDSTRRAVERAVSEGGLGIVLNCAGMGIAGRRRIRLKRPSARSLRSIILARCGLTGWCCPISARKEKGWCL